MKTAVVIFGILFGMQVFAADFGDVNCHVVLTEAENVIIGGQGNYYQARVAVSKVIIAAFFQNPSVQLQHSGGLAVVAPTSVTDNGSHWVYYFKLNFGAYYYSRSLTLIPYVTNGIDRLFDNNFGRGEVVLANYNNWKFRQNRCNF